MKLLLIAVSLCILASAQASDLPAQTLQKGDKIVTLAEIQTALHAHRLKKDGEPFYKKIRTNTKLQCFVNSNSLVKHSDDVDFHDGLEFFYDIPGNVEFTIQSVSYLDGSDHRIKVLAESGELNLSDDVNTLHKIHLKLDCRRDSLDFKFFTNNEIMISEIEKAFAGNIKFQ